MKVLRDAWVVAAAAWVFACTPGCVNLNASCEQEVGHGPQPATPVFASGRLNTTSKYHGRNAGDAEWMPSPVFKIVHREVNGTRSLTYHAMVSPWPLKDDGSSDPFSTKLTSLRKDWISWNEPTSSGGAWPGFLAAGMNGIPGVAAGVSAKADFDAVAIEQVDGYGWIYLTGDKPIVKTKWVIGGADGTTFFYQAARNGRTEYHRFALIQTPISGAGEKVTLHRLQSPDPGEPILTHQLPYAVYECASTGNSGQWHGPFASIPAGLPWDGMAASMNAAREQAIRANLPVSENPVP
ncbi:MAG: hypothetical protein KF787_04840 [Phycisphaeraceae bacterium]|nr:hypothetical protein [Phycisphaerae bacterium]MBX3391956.1 hypothetical protein [Phycisphaeraceae bacterium]